MKEKCDFCEYDRGPLMDRPEQCGTCIDNNNFQLKKRLPPSMVNEYAKFKRDEEWINDQSVEFDRDTALLVLGEISKRMHPSTDLFGNKTLTISRYNFEVIRKKFLDKKEKERK